MERYLEPYGGGVADTRNSTELSRFSERLVRTFLGYRASEASVSVHLTGYDTETLYKGLWNVCSKEDYRGRVRVHKQDGKLILVRERERRKV